MVTDKVIVTNIGLVTAKVMVIEISFGDNQSYGNKHGYGDKHNNDELHNIFEARHIMGTWLPNLLALFVTNDNYFAASVYGYGAW